MDRDEDAEPAEADPDRETSDAVVDADPRSADVGADVPDLVLDAGANASCVAVLTGQDPPAWYHGACEPGAGDYLPRDPAAHEWPDCISDDNEYHRIEESVSTIARVAAFDEIAALLWDNPELPSKQDFLKALELYAEPEGLASRVLRRYDVHYEPPTADFSCADEGAVERAPDYCVGPAKLGPIVDQALSAGAEGDSPRVQAARAEAALIWFLYVSTVKEMTTCRDTPKDCDSSWAYYSGGTERERPAGLARRFMELAPEVHQRVYDALLGVRCWKNLDNETGASQDEQLHSQIRAQLDRALLQGVAALTSQRFLDLDTCEDGEAHQAAAAFLDTLRPLLDRALRERDADFADAFAEGNWVDEAADLTASLDALLGCE